MAFDRPGLQTRACCGRARRGVEIVDAIISAAPPCDLHITMQFGQFVAEQILGYISHSLGEFRHRSLSISVSLDHLRRA